MNKYGRNELCPCGSGKKYKKCCIGKVDSFEDSKKNAFQNAARPSHDAWLGIREMCLAQLDQIRIYLQRKHKADSVIAVICNDLIELADNPEQKFIETWREMLELKGIIGKEFDFKFSLVKEKVLLGESISIVERTLIKQLMESNLDEYNFLNDMETCDYGAMYVLTDLCYKIIKKDELNDVYVNKINLYVDTGNELKEWDIEYYEALSSSEMIYDSDENYIYLNWVPLDEFEHEYESFAHELNGLSNESKKALANALYQEKKIKDVPNNMISYNGIANYYTGILEEELRFLIKSCDSEFERKSRLMWNDIRKSIDMNEIIFGRETINISIQLAVIHPIRNKIAHGVPISSEEFSVIKQICIDQELFKYIAWAKINLEDNAVGNSFI